MKDKPTFEELKASMIYWKRRTRELQRIVDKYQKVPRVRIHSVWHSNTVKLEFENCDEAEKFQDSIQEGSVNVKEK